MKEVKEKKKPILFYYIVALAVIFMFNAIARPYYDSKSVKQVDYGTFMNMTEDEKIADVQIEENQILFKDKDGNEYRTGVVNDPQLTERLHKANVSFNEVIKEKDSPFTDFLIAWILPILIFFGVGYYFNRKLMNHGGGNSLMFGAKNQVKVWLSNRELDKFVAEQQRHEQELLAGDLSFGPHYKACLFCPANPMSRGAKSTVFCGQAIRPTSQWSATDILHLVQVQNDTVRTTPREDDEL